MEQKHIVSFSGGKDSTAMLIHMIELNMQIDEIYFADTGLEFPEMYEYIIKIQNYIGREITILKEGNWDKWFYGKSTRGKSKGNMRGFPLRLYHCWHSREAKFKPLDHVCKNHIRYIGYAIDENFYKRQRMIVNYKKGIKKEGYKFPLVDWVWTENDCLKYLKNKGLHNPLYNKFNRLGCWCCPKQTSKSLRVLYNDYPQLWERLMNYYYDNNSVFTDAINLQKLNTQFKLEETR